ncbi:putative membrane protein [Thermoplasmatales archaeon SCGC AB-539-N05]|nr:putative membrane protein [Thermoplasmatales archaeon SCGC AB-539-N05]
MGMPKNSKLKNNKIKVIIFIFFLFWALLHFIIPLLLPANIITDLSGVVGLEDNEHLTNNLPFPSRLVYKLGDIMCHQKAERSFFINGNQMPFCSRCTGIFLGLSIGLMIVIFKKLRLDGKFIILLIAAFVPIGIDGIGQLFGFWKSNNLIRVITGLSAGIVCGIAIGLIVDEVTATFISKK